MFFFIIWGTKNRKETLGAVADWCPHCQEVQAFSVYQYYRVGHVYYIALGRGTLLATVRQCWKCCSDFGCDDERYDTFVPEKQAIPMSMTELLEETNPELKKRLDAYAQEEARRKEEAEIPEAERAE